ncbi:hypothetical protein ADIAL_0057 [Alkalibacterium sp. AK22]|uniref:hypothetical protein n=1 Tax=Alkalibacterium sp. AK22 TaxID=1229520 RepID=UPI0004495950|nr:hypothetical protein [Alkalibacterium sp. AK22]EXJ24318.1 hypothetical protein ADIAL_0057 [Alkalibacterium sp. AK22]
MSRKSPTFWKMFLVAMIPAVIFALLGEQSNLFVFFGVLLLVTVIESSIYQADKEK